MGDQTLGDVFVSLDFEEVVEELSEAIDRLPSAEASSWLRWQLGDTSEVEWVYSTDRHELFALLGERRILACFAIGIA